jgi:beta-glucosidase
MKSAPLWAFGHGLGYTRFEYGNLQVSPKKIRPGENVQVSVDVTNAGSRTGDEVVQLYLDDIVSSVSTPVKELRRFEKVPLKPGERKTVRFGLTAEDMTILDRNLQPVIEPGSFEVMVGASSEDIRLRGMFEVE